MQVNLSCNCPKPQFGMAIRTNQNVNKVLSSRIKNADEVRMLQEAFELAAKNKTVDINLMVQPDGKSLTANVFSPDSPHYFSQHSENWYTKLVKGPVGFIEDLVFKAEKAATKVQEQMFIEKTINKL